MLLITYKSGLRNKPESDSLNQKLQWGNAIPTFILRKGNKKYFKLLPQLQLSHIMYS